MMLYSFSSFSSLVIKCKYFAKRAEDAIDRLWDEGVLNDNVMEEWKSEHMRTPYKQ